MQQSLEEILRSRMAQPVSIKGKEGATLSWATEKDEKEGTETPAGGDDNGGDDNGGDNGGGDNGGELEG